MLRSFLPRERKWRGVCASVPRGERDGQTETDGEDTVIVRAAGPHSAVNGANTRGRQASQCTQESAVKHQGEARTRTAVTEACFTARWKGAATAGQKGSRALHLSTFEL